MLAWEICNSLQSYFTRPVFIRYVKFLNTIDDTASRGDVFQCNYTEITDSILKLYKKFGEYLMFVCSKLKQMLNYSDAVEILRQEK